MSYDSFRMRFKWLFDILLDNVFINNVYERMLRRGWNYKVYDLLFFRRQQEYERLHPTEDMIECRQYFANHKQEIDECRGLLSDSLSRDVFDKAIDFRCNHNHNVFPPYNVSDQYFPKDIIQLSEHEVFVDCGACRGDTYRSFRRVSKDQYRRVVCFETEKKNCAFIHKACRNDPRLVVIPKGVWSENKTLRFEALGLDWNGRFIAEGEEPSGNVMELPVCTIDSQEDCRDATFIKMDVEGSEWEALHGAEETILRNHPKLAICLYHSPQDYLRIPLYIHQLNPNYRLFIRHHSTLWCETVMYAI